MNEKFPIPESLNVFELVLLYESIRAGIEDLENSLKKIRGDKWNYGIENDKRIPVVLLNTELKGFNEALSVLQTRRVIVTNEYKETE